MQIPAAKQPAEPVVGHSRPREDDALQLGAVDPEHGRHVVVALFGQGQHPQVVEKLEHVRDEIRRDPRTVRLLQVELLRIGEL